MSGKSRRTKKDREISRVWNRWNTNFRIGFMAAQRGEQNPGKIDGTTSERGQHHGWTWANKGNELPDDPMWTVLDADRLFTP